MNYSLIWQNITPYLENGAHCQSSCQLSTILYYQVSILIQEKNFLMTKVNFFPDQTQEFRLGTQNLIFGASETVSWKMGLRQVEQQVFFYKFF